jgi:hypothetical protein
MTSPRDILTALVMLCFFLTIRSPAKHVMALPICTFLMGSVVYGRGLSRWDPCSVCCTTSPRRCYRQNILDIFRALWQLIEDGLWL